MTLTEFKANLFLFGFDEMNPSIYTHSAFTIYLCESTSDRCINIFSRVKSNYVVSPRNNVNFAFQESVDYLAKNLT